MENKVKYIQENITKQSLKKCKKRNTLNAVRVARLLFVEGKRQYPHIRALMVGTLNPFHPFPCPLTKGYVKTGLLTHLPIQLADVSNAMSHKQYNDE